MCRGPGHVSRSGDTALFNALTFAGRCRLCRVYRVCTECVPSASSIITIDVAVHVICLVYIQLGGIDGVNFILSM